MGLGGSDMGMGKVVSDMGTGGIDLGMNIGGSVDSCATCNPDAGCQNGLRKM